MRKMCKSQFVASCIAIGVATFGSASAGPPRAPIQEVQIVAEKMCCQGCVRKVSGQLYTARGVKNVSADLPAHTLTVSLPRPNVATLGKLWQAVEVGDGAPSRIVTPEATYSMTIAAREETAQRVPPEDTRLYIVVDNLHCKGCATKIAAQLYPLKGVTAVSVDMSQATLIVERKPKQQLSAWRVVDAVLAAKERPVSVRDASGELTIEWATEASPDNHHQAQFPQTGGIVR